MRGFSAGNGHRVFTHAYSELTALARILLASLPQASEFGEARLLLKPNDVF
jgi:hypothetical protein